MEGDDIAYLAVGDGHVLVLSVEADQVLVRTLGVAHVEHLVAKLEHQVLGHGQGRAVGKDDLLVVAGRHIIAVGGGTILLDVHVLRGILSLATGHIVSSFSHNLCGRLCIDDKRPRHLALGAARLEVQDVATLGSQLHAVNLHGGDGQRVVGRGLQLKVNQVEGDTRGKSALNTVEGCLFSAETALEHENSGGGVLNAGDVGECHGDFTRAGIDLLAFTEAEADVAQLNLCHDAQARKECHKGKRRYSLHKQVKIINDFSVC